MVDKKSGSVRPPVIDAKARETGQEKSAGPEKEASPATPLPPVNAPEVSTDGTEKSAGETSAGKTELAPDSEPVSSDAGKATPETPAQPAPLARDMPKIYLFTATAVGGALLGLVLAYGLALAGWWPQPGQSADRGRIETLETRIAEVESSMQQQDPDIPALANRVEDFEITITDRMAALDEQISALGEMEPEGLAELQQRLSTLSLRLDAVAAGASATDAEAISDEMTALRDRLDALSLAAEQTDDRLATLETISAAQPELETLRAEQERALQLSPALVSFEAELAAGRPFAIPLATLEGLLPALDVPDRVRTASATGLQSEGQILAGYRNALPDLLAARPRDPDANWLDSLLGDAQSALALRPAGEIDGDHPDALIARGEAGLERGDFAMALAAFNAMPAPMQEVIASIIATLEVRLAAENVLDEARRRSAADAREAMQ